MTLREHIPEPVCKVFDDWFRGSQVEVVQVWHDSPPCTTYFVVALETETRVLHCVRIFALSNASLQINWHLSIDSKTELDNFCGVS